MKVIVLLMLSVSAFAGKIFGPVPSLRNGIGGKIVGGQEADEGEYPWQVSWRRSAGSDGSHSCGGSIMNENWVLSAGHCCAGLGDDGEIVAGTNDRFGDDDAQYRSYEHIIHPEYNSGNVNNDVCLLRLSEPLNMTNPMSVRAIPLNRRDDFEADEPFTVTGWGTLQSGGSSLPERLMEVVVPFQTHQRCAIEYFPNSITDGMICAGEHGKDSCQGDSGGPMVHFDESGEAALVGVVSWGIGCGGYFKPGVYAKVAYYADWIEETILTNEF